MKKVCAWCGVVLEAGEEGGLVSHGMCAACEEKANEELDRFDSPGGYERNSKHTESNTMETTTHTIEENGLFARASMYDGMWRVVARRPHQTTWTVLGSFGGNGLAEETVIACVRVMCTEKARLVRF